MKYLHKPGARINVLNDPESMPGVSRHAEVSINTIGLRGLHPASESNRVLVIGGSTVLDLALADGRTWCHWLDRSLGPAWWVGNAGRSGMRLRHALAHVEALVPRHRPTHVIVLCGLNDMLHDQELHRHPGVDDGISTAWGYDAETDQELEGDVVREIDFGSLLTKLKARRRLVRNWIDDRPAQVPTDFVFKLVKLHDAIKDFKAKPIFMTQPSLWPSGPEHMLYAGGVGACDRWFEEPETPWLTPRNLDQLLKAYNAATRGVCRTHKSAQLIDLARPDRGMSDPSYFYDDFHFSERGAVAVAQCAWRAFQSDPVTLYPIF